jgi:type IV secretory pathway TraG/TraD family ATPase VirD4
MAVFVSDRINGKLKSKHPHFLVIDEANFVNRRMLLELLSRARGAYVPTIVATQGPTDFLTNIPGEPGLESLVQNTNISIILNQGERNNAELCADIIGRGEKMSFSHVMREGEFVEGIGSARSTVDYLVSPDELRRLPQGEAIMRVGKPVEVVKWVKFPLRDPNF